MLDYKNVEYINYYMNKLMFELSDCNFKDKFKHISQHVGYNVENIYFQKDPYNPTQLEPVFSFKYNNLLP